MSAGIERCNAAQLLHEERGPVLDHCGLVAVYCPQDVPMLFTGLAGLQKLQTRGHDGAGFLCWTSDGKIYEHKGEGMVYDVFSPEIVQKYIGISAQVWVFQTRYGTDGASDIMNIQPIIGTHQETGEVFAVIHNGQYSDVPGRSGGRESDTRIFVEELSKSPEKSWEERILAMHEKKGGAWSTVVATKKALFFSRDRYGVRPLGYTVKKGSNGEDIWMVASETSALQVMGSGTWKEVLPDSIVKISSNGAEILRRPSNGQKPACCVFENIYIGDPESAIHVFRRDEDEINGAEKIYDFRRRCGKILAREAPLSLQDVDIAIGIPGTGIIGGKAYAQALGIPYMQAISDRNPQDDERTFMTPDITGIYEKALKHFHIRPILKGRRIVIIDDSLLRGNIAKALTKLLKEIYGVIVVHIRILSPQIDKGCYLGVNTRENSELASWRHDGEVEGIQQEVNADSLVFLSDEGLLEAIGTRKGICRGCMQYHYPPIDRYGEEIIFPPSPSSPPLLSLGNRV